MDFKIALISILVAIVFTIVCILIGSKLHSLRGRRLSKKNEMLYVGKWVSISYWLMFGERPRLCPILEGRVDRVVDNIACGIAILDITNIPEELYEKLNLKNQNKLIEDFGWAIVNFFIDLYDDEGIQLLQGPFDSSPFDGVESKLDHYTKLSSFQIPTIGIPSFDNKGNILRNEIKVFSKKELKTAFSDLAGFKRDLFIIDTDLKS